MSMIMQINGVSFECDIFLFFYFKVASHIL